MSTGGFFSAGVDGARYRLKGGGVSGNAESELRRRMDFGEYGDPDIAAGVGDTGVRILTSPRGMLGKYNFGKSKDVERMELVEFRR